MTSPPGQTTTVLRAGDVAEHDSSSASATASSAATAAERGETTTTSETDLETEVDAENGGAVTAGAAPGSARLGLEPGLTEKEVEAEALFGAGGGQLPGEGVPMPGPGQLSSAGKEAPGEQQPASSSPPAQQQQGTRTQLQTTLIIVSLAAALFLSALDVTIVTVAIPTITQQFGSTAGYTWIGSAYMLATAASAPLWGKFSDIWGRKPVLLVAVGVFWVGSLLSAVSVGMTMLIAGRAVQGVGGGGIVILVYVCISDLFSMRDRGVYFGIMGMVWAVAGGIGPILGGVFTDKVSWRWCFYVNLPISGVGMLILAFVLKLHNPRTPMREGLAAVDWLGMSTIVWGTLMVLLGLEFGGVTFPWNSATVVCLIVFGLVVTGIFVVIEWKVAEYPVIPLRLFKVPSNIASLAVSACHGFVFISGGYYLPLYFQAVLGLSPLMSGVYVLPYTLSLSIVSAATGVIIRRTGNYLTSIIFGMAMMTLGFGLFIDLGPRTNWAKLIPFQLIAGIGVGPNFQSPLISLQTMVEPRDMASATATFSFIRQLSTSISVVVGGVVFQNRMQAQQAELLALLGPDIARLLTGANAAASVGLVAKLPGREGEIARGAYWNSMRTMLIMYAAVAGLGLFISFFVGSRKLSKEHEEHKTGLRSMKPADGTAGRAAAAGVDRDGGPDEEKALGDGEGGARSTGKDGGG